MYFNPDFARALLAYLVDVTSISTEFHRSVVFKNNDRKGEQHDFLEEFVRSGYVQKKREAQPNGTITIFKVVDVELFFNHIFNSLKNTPNFKHAALSLREARNKNLFMLVKDTAAMQPASPEVKAFNPPPPPPPPPVALPGPVVIDLSGVMERMTKIDTSIAELLEQNSINADGFINAFQLIIKEIRGIRSEVDAIKKDVAFLIEGLGGK